MPFPAEKVKQRLLKEALRQAAREQATGMLEIEERFSLIRTRLTTILYGCEADLAADEVKRMLRELLPLTREYLAEVASGVTREYLRRLSTATANLSAAAQAFFNDERIRRSDIDLFLRVLEVYGERCSKEKYDPADIVPQEMFLLANLIAANFEAYAEELA